jgi:hypothetical protein
VDAEGRVVVDAAEGVKIRLRVDGPLKEIEGDGRWKEPWVPTGMASAPELDGLVITGPAWSGENAKINVGLLGATALTARGGSVVVRHVPTWGCGGELTARTEYTATAFSKPLLMIFRAVYRPTRQVDAVADVSQYFVHEVRYRAEIEPTFERYLYAPLVRGVVRTAGGMKVLQAGSLHAYLAYVLVLAVILLIWLGGTT